MAPKPNAPKTDEIHHDAWERFKRAVDVVAKSPPRHKSAKKKETSADRQKKPLDSLKRATSRSKSNI